MTDTTPPAVDLPDTPDALVRQIAAAYDTGFRCGWADHAHDAPERFSHIERHAFEYGYNTAVYRRDHGGIPHKWH